MVNLNKYNLVKNLARACASVVLVLGVAQAADIPKKLNLPKHVNCPTATYMSNQWNVDTKRSQQNNATAYKKLICSSGHEAFILIFSKDNKISYKLVDHSNVKMSEKSSDMCKIVDNYCKK